MDPDQCNEMLNCRTKFLQYVDDSRLLAAKIEYDKLMNMSDSQFIDDHKFIIDTMLERSRKAESCMYQTVHDDRWILANHHFGVETHYYIDDDGFLVLKMEGMQNMPLVEQLAVAYEVSLYDQWSPFCQKSSLVARISKTELIAHAIIGTPFGITRDAVVNAYGVDCLYEHGTIVLLGESISEYEGVTLPENFPGYFHDRIDISFNAVVTLLSSEAAKLTVIAKVNPKINLPQFILNFFTKQLAGVFLYYLNQQAQEIADNPDSIYRQKIFENKSFYIDWVLPKLRAYCQHKAWKQPVIACLGDEYGLPIQDFDYCTLASNVKEIEVDNDASF